MHNTAMRYSFPISILSFLYLLSLSLSNTITLPLSHSAPTLPSQIPHLTNLASQSLSRARSLKNPRNAPTTAAPLSSHSYGGYSIPLDIGTPPQTLQFVFDTGSDVAWFPCTHKYLCINCSSFSSDKTKFIPKMSSTVRILGCLNKKCGWIHHTNTSQCRECGPHTTNCSEICPPYMIFYGSGSTAGFGLVDILNLPGRKVPNFAVGCSVVSTRQPVGIAGFGRGAASLPSQLGLNKFSFCLLSRKFDDTTKTTPLSLDMGAHNSAIKTRNITYTPFLKNPSISGRHAFSVYYYLTLRRITLGEKRVKIPYKYLKPGSDGNGGTIVDSGSTFTYMNRALYNLVVGELAAQTKGYKRASEVENATGLGFCYDVAGLEKVVLPEMKWHFKGGAEMVLPLENYFILADRDGGAICLAIVTDEGQVNGGPEIILGSFQMQNFYVEYDLRNERFGFTKQIC